MTRMNDSKETELKPCPLCEDTIINEHGVRDGRELRCRCGLTLTRYNGPNNDTHARLVEAWNTRSPDKAQLLKDTADWLSHHLPEFDLAAHSSCVYEYSRCVVRDLAHDCEIAKGYALLNRLSLQEPKTLLQRSKDTAPKRAERYSRALRNMKEQL